MVVDGDSKGDNRCDNKDEKGENAKKTNQTRL